MLLGILGAGLLANLLTGEGVIRDDDGVAQAGTWDIRAGVQKIWADQGL